MVSAHGYNENALCVWACPAMLQVAKLSGHKARILHMAAVSTCGIIGTANFCHSACCALSLSSCSCVLVLCFLLCVLVLHGYVPHTVWGIWQSPERTKVATAAADETLRIWDVFSPPKQHSGAKRKRAYDSSFTR